jgi:hypothetical protein
MAILGQDDSPNARAAGAALSVSSPHLALEVSWTHMRDRTVLDPFDATNHDWTENWIELSLSLRGWMSRHAWIAGRAGVGHLWQHENSPAYPNRTYPSTGPSIGARIGYDFYQSGRDTLGVYIDGDLLFVVPDVEPFGGAIGLVGVDYRFTP